MSNAKHTPGPWEIGPDFDNDGTREVPIGHRLKSGFVLTVAVALGGLKGQQENARLIAAAPELLEALRDTLDALECWTGSDSRIDKARAAIFKATGE
jgi:hypothetical protein